MDRKSYDEIADAFDALYDAENDVGDVINALTREAMAKRPDRWIGPATCGILNAWHREAREAREAGWAKALADAGWTDAEFTAELDRRCDALTAGGVA